MEHRIRWLSARLQFILLKHGGHRRRALTLQKLCCHYLFCLNAILLHIHRWITASVALVCLQFCRTLCLKNPQMIYVTYRDHIWSSFSRSLMKYYVVAGIEFCLILFTAVGLAVLLCIMTSWHGKLCLLLALFEGNPSVTDRFPSQMAIKAALW